MKCCKKKLLHFVFVFLLATFMISLKNTCSMAYTWEDIDEFNTQLLNNSEVNQTTKNYINLYNTRKQAIKNYFTNNNMNIEDWTGVTFQGSSTNQIYMLLERSTTQITKSSTILLATHCYIVWVKRDGSVTNNGTDYSVHIWANTNPYDYWGLTNGTYDQLFESNQYFENYYTPPPTFTFKFYDESITSSVPNGETAYCVFLDPITDNQKIGYIEDFENHKNTKIQIFAQNYRNVDNVLVNSIGEMNYYLNESGELFVNTNTMWSALVYEIVGIDNGPSGDFLNGQNFTAYYYIAAGSNVSGDANFYGADYSNNQFFLWKLLGNFGDGSGDPRRWLVWWSLSIIYSRQRFFPNLF